MFYFIACTGHRPKYYPDISEQQLASIVDRAINHHVHLALGRPIFRVGMALGWDQMIAQRCLERSYIYHAYLPFIGQENKWTEEQKERYFYLKENAQEVIITTAMHDQQDRRPIEEKRKEGNGYSKSSMMRRNRIMIDGVPDEPALGGLCDCVCALWNGESSGTGNAMNYAKYRDRPFENWWREIERLRGNLPSEE